MNDPFEKSLKYRRVRDGSNGSPDCRARRSEFFLAGEKYEFAGFLDCAAVDDGLIRYGFFHLQDSR